MMGGQCPNTTALSISKSTTSGHFVMPLETLLKLLSAAKLPLAVGFFGLVLNAGGSNIFLKNTGATVAIASAGCAVATLSSKDDSLREIRALQERHDSETALLKRTADSSLADVAAAQKVAQQQAAMVEQLKQGMAQMQGSMAEVKADCDRVKAEVLAVGSQANQAAAALSACRNDNSQLAGEIEALYEERMQLIYELYETAVTEANLSSAITGLETQFANDSAYQLGQKKKVKSELAKALANFHTEIAEANAKIEELERALAEKTTLATQMLAELEGDANGTFTHFSGKANAQGEIINGLKTQLEELRKTNNALTFRRFDNVGTDNMIGNRLIDFLAKHGGSTYGAFHSEREGHNGRLKIWLTMIDAPLKRAQDCLDDMEAELKLWAKPTVKVDKGMHLFTLATEQEHKVIQLLTDNLNRFEKDFDKANHIRLVGPTGSGKSTFLDNLIWLGRYMWPTAKMELLDPKAPFTVWQGGITPDHKNLECVAAIENISYELQSRFNGANKVAEKFGNESDEFSRYIDCLAPYLFVLDEAQYLYRIAKAEDAKQTPKGKLANLVRDSLLDCLGVGRALKVKGYFITQSAKCAKLNMNEDDFDNATSIFLGSAISNALDGELKGAFSDTKLSKVRAEYIHRKQLGQQYLALVSYSESDTLYLIQAPQPGFYHSRFLTAQEDFDPGTAKKVQQVQTLELSEVQQGAASGTAQISTSLAPDADSTCSQPSTIAKGKAACPSCSTFSDTIRNANVNSLGKVKFTCKNVECKKQIFSAVPI
jgi:flagellar biosynthesis GTPase FlhF